MSYRFVKVTEFYPDYLHRLYNSNPGLSSMPYAGQLQFLMADGFGWADFFSRYLCAYGIDAHEIVMNADLLQRTWAYEHGINEKVSLRDILWQQLTELNPEVIFFENPSAVNWDFLLRCRQELSNLRFLIGWCACPFSKGSLFIFSRFDLMLTSGVRFVQDFSAKSLPVRLMRHGFEPSMLDALACGEEAKNADIIFLGSFFSGTGFHDERWRFFKDLLFSDFDLALHTSLPLERLQEVVDPRYLDAFQRSRGTGLGKPNFLDYGALASFLEGEGQMQAATVCRQIKQPVFGKEMFAALSKARIGIHVHPDVSGQYTGGMRPFEVTGMGACLLTDHKKDLHEIFSVGEEVLSFHSVAEAKKQILTLLANPDLRQEVASAGQQRTLSSHSYRQRADELLGHIGDLFAGKVGRKTQYFIPPYKILRQTCKKQLSRKLGAIGRRFIASV